MFESPKDLIAFLAYLAIVGFFFYHPSNRKYLKTRKALYIIMLIGFAATIYGQSFTKNQYVWLQK